MTENSKRSLSYRLIVTEWLTLAGMLLACFYFLYSEMKSIDNRIEQRMVCLEQRADRLYEMFIDLLKEKKGL